MQTAIARPLLAAALLFATSALAAPVPTDPPNVPTQRPAFAGQTRAPETRSNVAFQLTTIASGLDHPWGLAFLPDGRLLITERPGRLRLLAGGRLSPPIAGVPPVASGGQLGLFGLAVDPAFASNQRIYLALAAPAKGGPALTVVRARLVMTQGTASLAGVTTIFRAAPPKSGTANIGGRLVFAPDGTLFVTVGDRFQSKDMAQTLDNDLGKIVRIATDGSIPRSNPFVGRDGVRPEIWSYGHRNPEAAAINPTTHRLWTVEHGARGGDEVNIPMAGRNYGWPVITYGEDYSGQPIGAGITQKPGLEQPVYYWDPVIAPSGMTFYQGALFPAWRGSLFIGGLKDMRLTRLVLDGDRVVGEERLLKDLHERIRDVITGPDGALYIATDDDQGRVIRLSPK
jgi:glucose/arabinose dehydrogenase